MDDLFLFGQVKDLEHISSPMCFHMRDDIRLLVRKMTDEFSDITYVLMIQVLTGRSFISAFKQVFKMIDDIST